MLSLLLTMATACTLQGADQAVSQNTLLEAASHFPATYYFKQLKSHALVPGRLLLKSRAGRYELENLLMQMGIDNPLATALPYEGMWLVETRDGMQDSRLLRDRLDRLLLNPIVSYAAPVLVGERPGAWFAPTQDLLMEYTQSASEREVEASLLGMATREPIKDGLGASARSYLVPLDSRNGFDVMARSRELAQQGSVLFAEPNMIATMNSDETPNDPFYSSQWALDNNGSFGMAGIDMDADIAWENPLFGVTTNILILDNGVQMNHPDLVQGSLGGADFSTGSAMPGGGPTSPCENHGTAVAGVMVATWGNGIGVAGLARHSKFLSARVNTVDANCNQFILFASVVAALDWGQLNSCTVSNNSNSYGGRSSAIDQKYQSTRDNGMLHFAAAGNHDTANPGAFTGVVYPADLPSVNAVSALTKDGVLADFSNYGPEVAFTGPGQFIATTDRTGFDGYFLSDYGYLDGTSFASPLVAAVAAQYISYHAQTGLPGTFPTPVETEFALVSGALDLGPVGKDDQFGWGLPSAAEAVLYQTFETYGTGSAGCEGPLTHMAWGVARPNQFMELTVNHAPKNKNGFHFASTGQELPGVTVLGAISLVNVGQIFQTTALTSDTVGDGTLSVQVPNDPALIGQSIYSQFWWKFPTTNCTLGGQNWATSNGLKITVE